MPKYKIQSGEFKTTIKTAYNAEPRALAIMALSKAFGVPLGTLTEVKGGQFKGDDVVYMSTERVLRDMGAFES